MVADEVRKLAEKAGTSSREIAELVRAVQRGTEEAVRATEEGASNVAHGVKGARGACKALDGILTAAHQNSESTANVRAASAEVRGLAAQVANALGVVSAVGERNLASAQEMTGSIGEVARAMENVAAVAQENAASAEEVSATAEELSAQVEQVSGSAEELSALAEQLNQAIGGFRLNPPHDEDDAPQTTETARSVSHGPSPSGGGGERGYKALNLLSA